MRPTPTGLGAQGLRKLWATEHFPLGTQNLPRYSLYSRFLPCRHAPPDGLLRAFTLVALMLGLFASAGSSPARRPILIVTTSFRFDCRPTHCSQSSPAYA